MSAYTSLVFQKRQTIRELFEELLSTDLTDVQDHSVLKQKFSIFGRVDTFRFSGDKNILFISFSDGSTARYLQCICDKSRGLNIDVSELWDKVSRGASLYLEGDIVKSPAKGQPFEMVITGYKIVGPITDPGSYPLASRGFISRDTLRVQPHIRGQTKLFTVLELLKSSMYWSIHETMHQLGITETKPTEITANECESGAYPFTVTTILPDDGVIQKIPVKSDGFTIDHQKDFFGERVYLTVSSQLHLEATVVSSCQDKYCMTIAFRAEPSTGPFHLAEFLMPEWETIGADLMQNMAIAETVLKNCFRDILAKYKYELEYLDQYKLSEIDHFKGLELPETADVKREMKGLEKSRKHLSDDQYSIKLDKIKKKYALYFEKLPIIEEKFRDLLERPPLIERLTKYVERPFVISTHAECVRLMLEAVNEGRVTFTEMPGYEEDLSKEHERFITEVLYGGMPVFVRYFPKKIKAFYMPVIDAGAEVEHVDGYDLLFPYVGEVVGGSQRVDDYQVLESRMDEIGMKKEPLQWYLDLRKYGSLPHGGAGLGFGRLGIVVSGITQIRDMESFPRGYGLGCFA